MTTRALVFLSLMPSFLLGLGDGLRAQQQQDAGSAARRVIIFVWDGLRADDVTPENMPNYFALARPGVAFADRPLNGRVFLRPELHQAVLRRAGTRS
jgi:predicted AlkP superfamily pyrophosphatase or phosphodiesterase